MRTGIGALAVVLVGAALPALAQEVTELDTVIITSTRTGLDPFETLSGSTGVSKKRLEVEVQGGTVSDIVTLVPGLTTQTTGDDPGTGVNIRGMQDFGRVNVMIDGARQNFQKNGHEANGTFYVDTEMLSTVDVTRGPSSSVYGSGAIGGVVNLGTITADDVLDDERQIGGRVRTAFHYNGTGPVLHGEVALRPSEALDAVLAGTWKSLGDYSSGDGTTVRSAEDLLSGLAKARIRPADGHEVTLSAMRYVNSWESTGDRETNVVADTYSAGYRFTPSDSDFWDLSAKVYYTGTDFGQAETVGANAGAERSFRLGTIGVDVFNTSRFDTGEFSHELTYGGDLFRDSVNTTDPVGTSDDLTPSGDRLAWGAFVQDRVSLGDWLEVIGALRYDAFTLGNDAISGKGARLSPKITVGVTPWEPVTFYATYAEGYRAPALTEMLIDGLHPPPVSAGRFFPNPALKPEVARTVEGGVNLRFDDLAADGDSLRVKAGVFRNDVDDYIDQVFMMFPLPGGYQYQNVAKARIEGIELEASYDAGSVFGSLAAHVLRGENRITGEPLQKVPPHRLVATVGLRAFEERLTLGTRLTAVAAKPEAFDLGFVGEAYALVDVFARWQLTEKTTADLALNNIFNRDYTQYLNGSPSAGFNGRLSLTFDF
ncbi:MAG: TonB-dependent hemoglobin/transferrin/lactoferrin family receptor [Rhizobiaceae bacterium]|nr:TonB-dependent hemoglobin/transferrin/lactoferrin family receptor [Rhizobiaceae bacterium]